MARPNRIKSKQVGVTYYHLMSRTANKVFLFSKGQVKTCLVDLLKRAAAFSGIELKAYVAMDNHFHIVCKVTRSEEKVPREELLRRYEILKGKLKAVKLADRWSELAAAGFDATLEAEEEQLRRRMNDISEFMKTFKEEFHILYKRDHECYGGIWSGRFKSTLIEDGDYLAMCKRYVELNPVRAGIVTQVKDYRWVWSEKPQENEVSVGPGPVEEWLMQRVAQIGEGKIFGSFGFVSKERYGYGSCFKGGAAVRWVGEGAYSTHGWKVA